MTEPIERDPAYIAYREKAIREHLPMFGRFELTARCNLDCKMCYVHTTDAAETRKKELTAEEWKAIFDAAIAAGMKRALLTGGECLLRDDFEELYASLYDRGIIVDINTNGLLLNEERIAFLEKRRPARFQISLYGSDDNAYERVTGHREFGRILRVLDLLEAHAIKPEIALTVSRYMAGDLLALVRLAVKRKLSYTCNFSLMESREDRRLEDYALHTDEVIKLQKILRALTGKKIIAPDCPVPPPGGPGEALPGMPCSAGNTGFSVTWDGRMALCLSFPEISADLRKEGFDASWRMIREKADAVMQPADCVNCAYLAHCPRCPAQRFDGLYSGKCRPAQCEETVRRYEAGLFSLKDTDTDDHSADT